MSPKLVDKLKKSNRKVLGSTGLLSKVDEWISTGCYPLDLIMGGGVPVGRMVEIYGDYSTGKTLVAQHILAQCQAVGGTAVLIDTETAIDEELAGLIGLDIDNLVYPDPPPATVEDVFEEINELLFAKEEVDPDGMMVIVWDSVAATSSQEEIDTVRKKGLGGRSSYASHARLISMMMRVMHAELPRNKTSLVMTNQIRDKIGVMFGDNVTTFGGKAIRFYTSIRIELAQSRKIVEGDATVGVYGKAYVSKNKVAPPFGKCMFPILFDRGIDNPGAVFDWLKDREAIVMKGGWYEIDTIKFRRREWPEIFAENEGTILEMMQR